MEQTSKPQARASDGEDCPKRSRGGRIELGIRMYVSLPHRWQRSAFDPRFEHCAACGKVREVVRA